MGMPHATQLPQRDSGKPVDSLGAVSR